MRRRTAILVLAMCASLFSPLVAHAADPPVVIAGTGSDGPLRNDILATAAQLWGPADVASTADGTVFIADANHHQVRKIGPDGIIRAALGSGVQGCDAAGSGVLFQPKGLATDLAGNIYAANTQCGQIQRLAPDGTVTVMAGRFDPNGNYSPITDGMVATQASLRQPAGLDYDEATATLYIAEQYSHRVLKVVSGTISVVAGTGANGFSGDGGPATAAMLNYPRDALFANGKLYIADSSNCRIRVVDAAGVINTLPGTGNCSDSVSGLAADAAGNLIIASGTSGVIREYNTAGVMSTVTQLPGGLGGIAFTPQGDLLVPSAGLSQSVYKITGLTAPEEPPPPPPPASDGEQHGAVTNVTWSVTPTTPLWNLRVMVSLTNVMCPATLTITAGTWTKRPTLCGAGDTAPSTFTFNWKVFSAANALPPGQDVPISASVATSDVPRYGGATTTLAVPSAPVWVGIGDSYSSGHHQDKDDIACTPQALPIVGPCHPVSLLENDTSFSWVTLATARLNQDVPIAWRYRVLVVAQSGATTQEMLAQGQIDAATQAVAARGQTWSIISMTGGANNADFGLALKGFYAAHPTGNTKPWSASKLSDCPDTQSLYLRALAQSDDIRHDLAEIVARGRAASQSVRFVDMLYPYVLKAGNICNTNHQVSTPSDPTNFATRHGAASVIDVLDELHLELNGAGIVHVDLRPIFGANPLNQTQLTRYYGYPHPAGNGQDKMAMAAIKALK
jgi:NHL repeat